MSEMQRVELHTSLIYEGKLHVSSGLWLKHVEISNITVYLTVPDVNTYAI